MPTLTIQWFAPCRGETLECRYHFPRMFDEPDDHAEEIPADPQLRAQEKADEFRTHAERAAVFEGPRKFEARLIPTLDRDLRRTVKRREYQRTSMQSGTFHFDMLSHSHADTAFYTL